MDTISTLDVTGLTPSTVGRLEFVANMVDRHLDALREARHAGRGLLPPVWAHAPAFELHIHGGLASIMADEECRTLLRHIVVCGEDARVVTFLHEPLEAVTETLTAWSGALAAALVAGRTLRHVSQRAVVPS